MTHATARQHTRHSLAHWRPAATCPQSVRGPARTIDALRRRLRTCQKSVQWLLDHDTEGKLRFAPLQGETAQPILEAHEELKDVDSVVYVEGDEAFVRSARSSS
ncbi:MAG: DCC1-like thiol-disulfide oxidoreductase family protein [Myxococcota bacterium]